MKGSTAESSLGTITGTQISVLDAMLNFVLHSATLVYTLWCQQAKLKMYTVLWRHFAAAEMKDSLFIVSCERMQ